MRRWFVCAVPALRTARTQRWTGSPPRSRSHIYRRVYRPESELRSLKSAQSSDSPRAGSTSGPVGLNSKVKTRHGVKFICSPKIPDRIYMCLWADDKTRPNLTFYCILLRSCSQSDWLSAIKTETPQVTFQYLS